MIEALSDEKSRGWWVAVPSEVAVLTGEINRVGLLEESLTKDLLICVTHSEDITEYQLELVQESLSSLS